MRAARRLPWRLFAPRAALAQTFTQTDIPGPPGSRHFGASVTPLANGNFVVTDPLFDAPGVENAGAAYLYDGATLQMISQITGSTSQDQVGSGGVRALPNSNFVVLSPQWDSPSAADVGAVTWGSGTAGVSGAVSADNSLAGAAAGDRLGDAGSSTLESGNFFVVARYVSNGGTANAGAVALGSGRLPAAGAQRFQQRARGTAGGGAEMVADFEPVRQVVVVGRPFDNIATVAALRFALLVVRAGNGSSTVSSQPMGIACGATCSVLINSRLTLMLTAPPAADSQFAGWSGACTGLSVCAVIMDAPHTVTALFERKQVDVEVHPSGVGGTIAVTVVAPAADAQAAQVPVAVDPAQDAAVQTLYPFGTRLRFTALPAAGYRFTGWSGSLSGAKNPQEVTLTAPLDVRAVFAPLPVYLPAVAR